MTKQVYKVTGLTQRFCFTK